MIADQIQNASLYYKLGERIETALRDLAGRDIRSMEKGQYPIRGEEIYLIVARYVPRSPHGARFEAHRRYFDVQYIVDGHELMGYAPLDRISVTKEYDPEMDSLLGTGDGDFIKGSPGTFFVLGPKDAHMPGIAPASGQADEVTKAIIKVAVW